MLKKLHKTTSIYTSIDRQDDANMYDVINVEMLGAVVKEVKRKWRQW